MHVRNINSQHRRIPAPHLYMKGNRARPQNGDFLIEAIVSVLVSSIIATAMVQMYTQVRRVGNMSQGEFIAAAVAQEAIDHLRSLPFDTVANNLGTRQVVVNGGATGDPLFPTALLQDTAPFTTPNGNQNLDYTGGNGSDTAIAAGANNVLRTVSPTTGQLTNTISVDIQPWNGSTDTLRITVDIAFLDSSGKPHSVTMGAMLNRLGLTG